MKKIVKLILVAFAVCANTLTAQEANNTNTATDKWMGSRPDGHAPISVMGDHLHSKGGFMLSYRYMPMWMDGNLQGSDEISNQGIADAGFRVAPQEMLMSMHMLGAMYAPSDNVTLMVMANYISNDMDLQVLGNGLDFITKSGGLADTKVGALVKLANKNKQAFHANISLSVPTGSIDERDDLPVRDNARLAYTMQTSSGTFDPSAGVTYLGQSDLFSWGAQLNYLTRLGRNTADYRLGDKASAVAWGAIKASEAISFSTSLSFMKLGDITGVDPEHAMFVVANLAPLFNTNNSGRTQLDLGLGSNYLVTSGALKNLRLAVEFQLPIVQEVNGIQMKNEFMATFGVQYAFAHRH